MSEKKSEIVLKNADLCELFLKNKKAIYSIVIFEEFLKEVTGCLFVKELAVEMLEAYYSTHLEDVKLECAIATFSSNPIQHAHN